MKDYEDVTKEYAGMITAFDADFSLATNYDELDCIDFRKLFTNKDKKLLNDIELLSKLCFGIRHGTIKIMRG